MKTLQPIRYVQDLNRTNRGHIHYMALDGKNTLCNRGKKRYIEFHGTKIDQFVPTPEPVNCLACRKAVEIVARMQLASLTPEQLVEIINQIQVIKNGQVK